MFGSKKDNQNLRTLSEKEIHEKLYGRLVRKGATSQAKESHSVKSASSEVQSVPDPVEPDNHETPDLFESKEEEVVEQVKTPIQEKVSRWSRQENETVSSISYERAKTSRLEPQPSKPTKPTPEYVKLFQAAAIRFLKACYQTFLGLAKVAASALLGLLLSIDFRKPLIRKIAYWASALVVIAGLLFAVHFLNVRRESAMTSPRASSPIEESKQAEPNENAAKTSDASKSESEQIRTEKSIEKKNETVAQAGDNRAVDMAGRYTIQVATYAGPQDAERITNRFREFSLPAFIQALTRQSGKVYHCVFIGNYESFADAEKALEDFKKLEIARPFQDSFIRKL